MYEIKAVQDSAKAALFHTGHGVIKTPVFMNVATQGAIKGALSAEDLRAVGCQVALGNAYHLHVRPGDELVRDMGGLHGFMGWDGPILTDSGGFQVFSLRGLRKISEEGVIFASHVDGRRIFMGPEESIRIQANLGADIAMAFDECIPARADLSYVTASVRRTSRWLERCMRKHEALRGEGLAQEQALFGICQGGLYLDVRAEHARRIAELDLAGMAIGGLAVGETHEEMYAVLEAVVPLLPRDKPTYLMGVGTPANIVEAVYRGVDFFDCVMPARNGRHGHVFTNEGKLNLMNKRFERDQRPIEDGCPCPACAKFSRAYIRHLFKAGELLALRLCVLHNLYYYNNLMSKIHMSIIDKTFHNLRKEILEIYSRDRGHVV